MSIRRQLAISTRANRTIGRDTGSAVVFLYCINQHAIVSHNVLRTENNRICIEVNCKVMNTRTAQAKQLATKTPNAAILWTTRLTDIHKLFGCARARAKPRECENMRGNQFKMDWLPWEYNQSEQSKLFISLLTRANQAPKN